jgi:molecular chaperone DnaJ
MNMDPYAILEVERSASARRIRSAYRRLARTYHPDHNPHGDAADRFKAIAEAYGILSDTSRRAAYDQWGRTSIVGTTVTDDDQGDFAFE